MKEIFPVNIIRVSAVSYTNTQPFVYGLVHSAILRKINLSLDVPAECAQKLIHREVDIGLVPVASLLQITDYQIISDYCIGANGAVDSVFIFSNKPIDQVRTMRLDPQSRTSNRLARVLLKNYWMLSPDFVESGDTDAYVEIGDRTFGKKKHVNYVYDLSEAWTNFSGLPFVFAVWAANKSIPLDFISEFNSALKYGLDRRNEVIAALPLRVDFDLNHYLMNQIDFHFDDPKKQALRRFLELVKELELAENTATLT